MRGCVIGVIAGVMASITHARAVVWQSDLALWQDAQRQAPLKVRPAVNLSDAYRQQGEFDYAWMWAVYAARLSANPNRPAHERREGRAFAFLQQGMAASVRHDPITACLAFQSASLADPLMPYVREVWAWAHCSP